MAKGKSRRGREEKKPKQKKAEAAPVASFNTSLNIGKKPTPKKN